MAHVGTQSHKKKLSDINNSAFSHLNLHFYIFASGGIHKVVFMHPIVALRTLGLHTAMLGITEISFTE